MMTYLDVTLSIPQYLYDRARRMAEEKALPIEEILVRQLELTLVDLPTLPPDEQAELDALTHLSDDALWTIAREQMEMEQQGRMQVLMTRNNMGTIASDEHAELTKLVDQGQRLMLRKGKAMALLTERGYHIRPESLIRD
ncbi:MAG: hypothetical protein JXB30_16115 [Anaerolineae bacterium]|nr:hypothetical protein [Anaerolineae bacterium]